MKKIRFLENFHGAYGLQYGKGSVITCEEETEDAFIVIAGHGHSVLIPKDKVEVIEEKKFMDRREICIKMIEVIQWWTDEHGIETSGSMEAELAKEIYRRVFSDGMDIGHDEER